MHRSSSCFAVVLALGSPAAAQTSAVSQIRPVTATVRDAGTLHLVTNTWTRKASAAHIGADVIYDNTCSSGYFSPLSLSTFVDEGRIPSTTSPTNLASRPGCENSYTIDGFQVAYCTDQTAGALGTYTINFYQSYVPCSTTVGVTPTAGFAIGGLPASATPGTLACWVVTIDLDSPPQSASLAFVMQADGDGTWAAPDNTNLFGWSMASTAPGTSTGPFIAGDPNVCQHFDGTRWDSPVNYAEAGTGMGSLNQFRVQAVPPSYTGCFFFGGSPFASFHLELYADACGPTTTPGSSFCFGDGAAGNTPCPCANHSATAAAAGCLNSFGTAGTLRASGVPSLSADTVVLSAGGLPASSVLFFQGTTRQTSGGLNGSLFGDGLRCAGGSVIRLKTNTAAGAPGSAVSAYPQTGDPSVSVRGAITTPGVRTYQAWYRNSAAFCTTAVFNLSNGFELVWGA